MANRKCPVCNGTSVVCWACHGTGEVDEGAVKAAIEDRARAMEARKEGAWRGLRKAKCNSR